MYKRPLAMETVNFEVIFVAYKETEHNTTLPTSHFQQGLMVLNHKYKVTKNVFQTLGQYN